MNVSALEFSSFIDVAEAIRIGRVKSIDLTKHILHRIGKYNPGINAIITFTREKALTRARAADEALAKGEWWGPLHGVPVTVKDCFETAGVRTTAGSKSLADHVPKRDAVAVSRLRSAGAIILGHTNVPVMAGDWQSYNDIFGTTNNPWDLKRTPGGSTGGGAAALAAGLSYLSLGSDIGGSIRIPAHFCGVYGHKPSLNIIPLRGHIPRSPYEPPILPVAGPLARSAKDLKVALEVMGGPDPEDAKAHRWSLPSQRRKSLSEYRIGYIVDDPNCPTSQPVREVGDKAVELLRNAGADLEEGWPEDMDPEKQFTTYRFLLACHFASFLRDDDFEEMKKRSLKQDGSHEAISAKAWTAPHKHFHTALDERGDAQKVWQKYFNTHDVFMIPTSFLPAFPHDHSQPFWGRIISTPEGPRRYEDLMFWISFATLSGLPSTVAPIGLTRDGLPVAIQVVGPYLEDATPISVAIYMSDLFGGFKTPKGY